MYLGIALHAKRILTQKVDFEALLGRTLEWCSSGVKGSAALELNFAELLSDLPRRKVSIDRLSLDKYTDSVCFAFVFCLIGNSYITKACFHATRHSLRWGLTIAKKGKTYLALVSENHLQLAEFFFIHAGYNAFNDTYRLNIHENEHDNDDF